MSDYKFEDWRNSSCLIKHPMWTQRSAELTALTSFAEQGQVILLVGPTRVGKSTLLNDFTNSLNNNAEKPRQPVLAVRAANEGGHGAFTMRSFTLRLLDAIQHPFLTNTPHLDLQKSAVSRLSEADLRRAVEKAIKYRGVKFLIIDEAQHIKRAQNGTNGQAKIIDSLKVLAENTGVVLVLSGSYELLDITSLSTHFVARSYPIHFARYSKSKSGITSFASILNIYNEILADVLSFNLLTKADILYSDTLGRIGAIDRWLRHSCAIASAYNKKIDEATLMASRQLDENIRDLHSEITNGEQRIKATASSNATKTSSSKKRKKILPFKTKPKRPPLNGRD